MLESKPFEIDGITYHVGHLPARDALRVAMRLAQLGGHTFGSLVGVSAGDPETVLALLVRGFADAYQVSDVDAVVLKLLGPVHTLGADGRALKLGEPATFDAYFAGRLGHATKVLAAAARHNFADFFGALTTELAGLIVKAAPQKPAPPATPTP